MLIIFVHAFLSIALIILAALYEQFNYEVGSLIYPGCCFLLILTIWFFWSWFAITKSLFSPYILFILSAVLFNGGQLILEVFHYNQKGILESEFSSNTLLETIFLVNLGLTFFHLGALISTVQVNAIPQTPVSPKKKPPSTIKESYQIGLALFSISFLPSLVVIKESFSIVLSSGYFGLYERDVPTSFDSLPQVLSGFLVPSALFILAGSKNKNSGKILSFLAIIIRTIIYFFLGQRNVGIMALLAFAWLWHQCIRPIPKALLFSIGGFILFIIFPLVGVSRNSAGADRLSIEYLVNTFSSINNPVVAIISEMGGSMNTVAYTIELVPKVKEFQMGADYFYAFLTLIPNLFWKLHPTIARGLPGNRLTWEVRPEFAARGGSLGFSFIAEAYENFGWVGAPIALAVIGFLFAKLILWATRSGDPTKMAMVASFTSQFLFYARSESASQVRSLIWYSLFPYMGVCLLSWLRSKKLLK